nr:MAG TPA: hypothetical protein [Caudoviricetes sp.]DAZ27238.1 MAG TPA: hypothetical protein [Caudoviricetes sp.]
MIPNRLLFVNHKSQIPCLKIFLIFFEKGLAFSFRSC